MKAKHKDDAWAFLYLWELELNNGDILRQKDDDVLVSGIDFQRDNPPKVLRLVPQKPELKTASVLIPTEATPVYCRRTATALTSPLSTSYHFCIGWTNKGGLLLLAVHPTTGDPTLLPPEPYRGQ